MLLHTDQNYNIFSRLSIVLLRENMDDRSIVPPFWRPQAVEVRRAPSRDPERSSAIPDAVAGKVVPLIEPEQRVGCRVNLNEGGAPEGRPNVSAPHEDVASRFGIDAGFEGCDDDVGIGIDNGG